MNLETEVRAYDDIEITSKKIMCTIKTSNNRTIMRVVDRKDVKAICIDYFKDTKGKHILCKIWVEVVLHNTMFILETKNDKHIDLADLIMLKQKIIEE